MLFRAILVGAIATAFLNEPALARESLEQRLERMEQIVRDQQQEISTLKAQRQSQAVAATPASDDVPAQHASQGDVEALQTQVHELTAVNRTSWWSKTKLSGRMYYDITLVDGISRAPGTPANPTGHSYNSANGVNFDIKRFYLGVDHTFDDIFSANLTTDFSYDSGAPSATQLYIKKAYLQAKLDDGLIFRLGAADLPWVPYVEDKYGYRYIENTMIDRDKYGTSADWGVHMLGTFMDGMFGYQVSAINGAGSKKAPTNPANRSGGIDVEGRINLNYEGFAVAVGGYHGQLGKDIKRATPVSPDTALRTANRFDVFAGYVADPIRLGVEYFYTDNWKSVTSSTTKDDARGVSVFGSYRFDPKWSVFGRHDWVNPTGTSAISGLQTADVTDRYFNVGVSYSPVKNIDFAFVYKHEKVDGGSMGTSNGTIGGPIDGTYNEFGLWGQFRW